MLIKQELLKVLRRAFSLLAEIVFCRLKLKTVDSGEKTEWAL